MAGNKIHKAKCKDDKNKCNKDNEQNEEEADGPDHSLLRKPILTSITGFRQARKIYDWATEELKHLLSHECDILYECKVCRNIFRSLANFISHKRVYCKENFNPNEHGHFAKPPSTITELLKIKHLEEEYQQSLKVNINNKVDCNEDERVPLTKDLTDVLEKIAKKNGIRNGHGEEPQTVLQKIPNTSVAVFQGTKTSGEKTVAGWDKQVNEIENALVSRGVAILQHDGNFKMNTRLNADPDNVIQISDDDEEESEGSNEILKCKICDLQFSTQKTLKFHLNYKHVDTRLVYPCPDCLEAFSTTWSVYRHMFKVHRKTAAQIRRLRESIQAKAFRMNNVPLMYERRRNIMKQRAAQKKAQLEKMRNIAEEERLDRENQAWLDTMEADGEGPRCGGCGRSFERRAALVAHTQTCAPRSRATKRIQIQIRRDYNKGPSSRKPLDANENKISEDVQSVPETANDKDSNSQNDEIDTDDVVELSKDSDRSDDRTKSIEKSDPEQTGRDSKQNEPLLKNVNVSENDPAVLDKADVQNHSEDQEVLEIQEIAVLQDEPVVHDMPVPVIRLPNSGIAETSNFNAFRRKIETDIELNTLLCKKCKNQSVTVQELYDHMATHYNWKRYACKLCPFKHYDFEKLPDHVIVVHKLNGDNDFYLSTVKALDGPTALELCENIDEPTANEISLESRQTSRCSSESGRMSDDSSSSSTRIDSGAKKRKMNQSIGSLKRKKSSPVKNTDETSNDASLPDKDTHNIENDNIKVFEENSSDLEELDDKIAKRQQVEDTPSMASRRPVRRKTKPKNEDFEYDLSNLLKMEAQGYRDSQTVTTTKSSYTKKKSPPEHQANYEILNKNCCGAMVTLAKSAVSKSKAHMKIVSYTNCIISKDLKNSRVFVRPMVPKIIPNGDKSSPKKEPSEDKKTSANVNKELNIQKLNDVPSKSKDKDATSESVKDPSDSIISNKLQNISSGSKEPVKTNLPTVVPIQFRRQSLEVIKNPLMNKNLKDLTKVGMKTKILVIKPINRNQDGSKGINTPLKFQTIKLKDPNKNTSSEDKSSDQVVVVKVPKVDCAVSRSSVESTIVSKLPTVTSDASDSRTVATEDTGELVPTLSSSSNSNTNKEEISDSSSSVNQLILSRQPDEGEMEIVSNNKNTSTADIC